MNLTEYEIKIKEIGFEEYPYFLAGNEILLNSFLSFKDTSIDLRIYLCKMLMCRCFSAATGNLVLPNDILWFIENMLKDYKIDLQKPWITEAIRESIQMITSDQMFTKVVIGTTFMFGVVEFQIKYKLGFRPNEYNFFDNRKKSYFRKYYKNKKLRPRELTISDAIQIFQQHNNTVGKILNQIDQHNKNRLLEMGIREGEWIIPTIAARLNVARNAMVHGETHSFYSIGHFLVILYFLNHLSIEFDEKHDYKEIQ